MLEIFLVITYLVALFIVYERREHLLAMSPLRKLVFAIALLIFPTTIIGWDLLNWLVYD